MTQASRFAILQHDVELAESGAANKVTASGSLPSEGALADDARGASASVTLETAKQPDVLSLQDGKRGLSLW